ncbi:MAG: Pre-mRNA-splicing factor 18 [Marteilia pararefringens]
MDVLLKEISKRKAAENVSKGDMIEENKLTKTTDIRTSLDSKEKNEDSEICVGKKELEPMPSIEEINRQFRLKGQPIILFGEDKIDRWQRLKKLKISEPDSDQSYKNDLKEAMKQAENNLFLQTLNSNYNTSNQSAACENSTKKIDFVYFELLEGQLGKGNSEFDMNIMVEFISFILQLWNAQLDKVPISERNTFKSKTDRANFIQTTHYLNPLIESIKKRNLSHDIVDSLTKILIFLIKKSYIEANGAYLELAIGNSPWPIGVTMSGIHNRPGKDRIATKNVAHVLNDETQRKYLQALKRIMKWCQTLFPTVPSKSMDYQK